jgi:immune inhibitor A
VLGWSDLATINPGQEKTVNIGPAEGASTSGWQALRVNLPNYIQDVTVFPVDGADPNYYYSGQGNDIETTMRRSLGSALGSDTELTFRTDYDIEEDWDYAYVEYSDDDGATWHSADGDLSTSTNPNGQNQGLGITGTSGAWVDGTYTIPAGATDIGFRYWTDGAVAQKGFAVDSIQLNGDPVDDATDPSVWTFDGFQQLTDGGYQVEQFHYYLVESRTYLRQDSNLCGVYQFLYGNWLEKWCNARGLVVWYRDSGYPDNNTSEHPGHGAVLVVDSHPEGVKQPGTQGGYWRERIQAWDAAFGVDANDITIHTVRYDGSLKPFPWHADPVSVFDDSVEGAYYDPAIPFASVITPGSGLRIEILKASANRSTYKVGVSWTD